MKIIFIYWEGSDTKLAEKGLHEKQMELAGDMLQKNIGLGQIVEETGLSEEDVLKKQKKMSKKVID